MPRPVPAIGAALALGIATEYGFTTLGGIADFHFVRQIGCYVGLDVVLDGVLGGLGTRTGHAQAVPVTYWIPSWSIGFGGDPNVDPGSHTYGNFPSFDRNGLRGGGFSHMRYNFPNGWFVGTEGGAMGLSMNGINQDGAFGNIRSLHYGGVQFGYNFQAAGNLPITLYAGFNTLKYNAGIGDPFASFDTSSTLPGYTAHAGVEFQPASNISRVDGAL